MFLLSCNINHHPWTLERLNTELEKKRSSDLRKHIGGFTSEFRSPWGREIKQVAEGMHHAIQAGSS